MVFVIAPIADCRKTHKCFGLEIYNSEKERKFQENVSFVANNYAKTDDRGYQITVENPNLRSHREKIHLVQTLKATTRRVQILPLLPKASLGKANPGNQKALQ